TLQDVLRQRPGWLEGQDEEWDFHWCDVGWLRENYGHAYLEDHVRICHFGQPLRADAQEPDGEEPEAAAPAPEREASPAEAALRLLPCTLELPCEYHLFVEEFKRSPGGTWIMKPARAAGPRDLPVPPRLKDVTDWRRGAAGRTRRARRGGARESYVAQRYIEDPYLISGRKFDLRVYLLVTSHRPLKAWLYRDGRAASPGRASAGSIRDQYAHLTNVACSARRPTTTRAAASGSCSSCAVYLTARHGARAVEALFGEIDNVGVRSLQSVQKVIINDKHCFELSRLRHHPGQGPEAVADRGERLASLNATCQQDYELKCRLLEDTLNVVDMEGRLTGREAQVGGFDLMWSDRPVYREDVNPPASVSPFRTPNTHLGCFNDRKSQLRKLFKPLAGQMAV
ncbi:hypothetical protein AAFF_G00017150, partial [Aldrovandia affinis]